MARCLAGSGAQAAATRPVAPMPCSSRMPRGISCQHVQQHAQLAPSSHIAQHSMAASQHHQRVVTASAGMLGELVFLEGYVEVAELLGSRIVMDGETPRMEYLVKWKESKDGSDMSWELGSNLSDDVIRDYDDKWWAAATKADLEGMAKMLAGGHEALSTVVDENGRSALHFAAARGSLDCVKLLLEAGADPDMQDKDGYTPLHMAAGYMHTTTMGALLEASANPQLKDNNGKDVVGLIGKLRAEMPLSPMTIQRRIALEQVASVLTDRVYDEVEPAKILNQRKRDDGTREFLVSFTDGGADEWIDEADCGQDIVEDWDAGLEYAVAKEIVDVVQVGTERRFKVVWEDDYPTSWEAEEHLPADLITLFQQQNPQLFQQRVDAAAEAGAGVWPANDAGWEAAAQAASGSENGMASSGDNREQHKDGYKTQYAKLHVSTS